MQDPLPLVSPSLLNVNLRQAPNDKSHDAKIAKSASDFESLLLTSWLQGAQESFASVPGGDEEESSDPGREQLQQLSLQSLGTALTARGGIGLARSIAELLHKSDSPQSPLKENGVNSH